VAPTVLLHFADEAPAAHALADVLGGAVAPLEIERHRFPDGELKLRLPATLPEEVLVWRGLQQPNDKLVELLLTAQTARQLGARRLALVAPYLAYMRQDMAFRPGEAVSQRIVGGFRGPAVRCGAHRRPPPAPCGHAGRGRTITDCP